MPKKVRFLSETPDQLIAALRQTARQNAASNWGQLTFGGFDPQGSQYGFADLRPSHVLLTNSTYFGRWSMTTIAAAGTATNWFNTNVHEDCYILVYGFFNNTPTPRVTELKFFFGGNELAWINVHQMWGWDITRGYFEQGWVISPNQAIQAQVTADAACVAQTEQIGLLGEVLCKRHYLIQYNAPR